MLTPVLCASLLKPVEKGHEAAEGGVWFLRPFFIRFNRAFSRTRDNYVALVGRSLARKARYFVIFLLIVGALGFLFKRLPTAYLPDEDQGILLAQVISRADSRAAWIAGSAGCCVTWAQPANSSAYRKSADR